jgi:hypothetical protein
MNSIDQLNYKYLTPNKTIETISVSNGVNQKSFFIYNYKGVSFRLFLSNEKLDRFWEGEAEEDHHFETEKGLDTFLTQYKL